jgi:hypothetical protein
MIPFGIGAEDLIGFLFVTNPFFGFCQRSPPAGYSPQCLPGVLPIPSPALGVKPLSLPLLKKIITHAKHGS